MHSNSICQQKTNNGSNFRILVLCAKYKNLINQQILRFCIPKPDHIIDIGNSDPSHDDHSHSRKIVPGKNRWMGRLEKEKAIAKDRNWIATKRKDRDLPLVANQITPDRVEKVRSRT